jgi:hypothetical protein
MFNIQFRYESHLEKNSKNKNENKNKMSNTWSKFNQN